MAFAKVGRKLKRTGKDAYKFQFTADCEQLSVHLKPEVTKWSPYKLFVSFSRGHRKVETSPVFFKSVVESGREGDATWSPPSELQLQVTLYKTMDAAKFDEKEYKFEIFNISKEGDEKCLAAFYCDMAQYVKADDDSKDVLSMSFKPSSKKIASATLDVTLQSKLIKKGKAGDDDMMSTASRLSQGDLRELDEELGEAERGTPAKPKVSRAEKKKMKKTLEHMANEGGDSPTTKKSAVADWLGVTAEPGSGEFDAMLQADSRFADAVLVDKEGASLPVSRLLGSAVIGVYFSAEWCPPCREFMPILKQFHEMLKEKGASFELVWVSSDKNEQTMQRYARTMNMAWPLLEYDHPLGSELRDSFEINSIPTLCIVDAVGNKIDHQGRAAVEKAVETNTAWSSYNLWLSKVSSSAMPAGAKPLDSSKDETAGSADKARSAKTTPTSSTASPTSPASPPAAAASRANPFGEDSMDGAQPAKTTTTSATTSPSAASPGNPFEEPAASPAKQEAKKSKDGRKSTTTPKEEPSAAAAVASSSAKPFDEPAADAAAPREKTGLLKGVKNLVTGKKDKKAAKAEAEQKASADDVIVESKKAKRASTDEGDRPEQAKILTKQISKAEPGSKEKKGLMDRLKAKDTQLEGVKEENRVLAGENERLKEENDSLTERVDELQLIVQDLRQQMEVVEAEKAKLQKRIDTQSVQLTLKGWLSKRGAVGPTKNVWRRRYFELAGGGLLHYFTESDDVNPKGTIDLNHMTGVQEHTPEQQTDATQACFKVITQSRTFELMAKDHDNMVKWINALDSYHSLLKKG